MTTTAAASTDRLARAARVARRRELAAKREARIANAKAVHRAMRKL
jgi:hypothetical protein